MMVPFWFRKKRSGIRPHHEQANLSEHHFSDDGESRGFAAHGLGGRRQIEKLGRERRLQHGKSIFRHFYKSSARIRKEAEQAEGLGYSPLLQQNCRQPGLFPLAERDGRSDRLGSA